MRGKQTIQWKESAHRENPKIKDPIKDINEVVHMCMPRLQYSVGTT
jgi:hypothetical protein